MYLIIYINYYLLFISFFFKIFNATDDSFEVIALDTIRSLVAAMSAGVIGKSDQLEQFLKTVITECMESLKEPELKLSKPSGRILKYCAMASGKISQLFLFLSTFYIYTYFILVSK